MKKAHGKKRKRRRSFQKDQKELERETKDLESAAINDNIATAARSPWLIGYNVTIRHLESMARKSLSFASDGKAQNRDAKALDDSRKMSTKLADTKPLEVVFVARSGKPPMLFDHLPYLILAIALASPSHPIPRLVSLPRGAEERLSAALSIPRVGLLGLVCGNPDADFLTEYIRENVPEVEAPQIDAAVKGTYLPISIRSFASGGPQASENHVHSYTGAVRDNG